MSNEKSNINVSDMFLIYEGDNGEHYYQHWMDVVNDGTLIDPETGEDMKIIGWTSTVS